MVDVITFAPDAWRLTDYIGIGLMGLSVVVFVVVAVMAYKHL